MLSVIIYNYNLFKSHLVSLSQTVLMCSFYYFNIELIHLFILSVILENLEKLTNSYY